MTDRRDPGALKEWIRLKRLRDDPATPQGPATQNVLGPREHRAYAYSRVREHPLWGPLEQLGGIPAYTLAKLLRLKSGRSDPSLEEMAEGYRGLGEGIGANIGDLFVREPAARPTAHVPVSQRLAEEGKLEDALRAWRRADASKEP